MWGWGVKKGTSGTMWANASCQKTQMHPYRYLPVPPAIIPTYFTVLVTGSAFFSGRISNLPEETKRWKTLKQAGNTSCYPFPAHPAKLTLFQPNHPSLPENRKSEDVLNKSNPDFKTWGTSDTEHGLWLIPDHSLHTHHLYFNLLTSHTPQWHSQAQILKTVLH